VIASIILDTCFARAQALSEGREWPPPRITPPPRRRRRRPGPCTNGASSGPTNTCGAVLVSACVKQE
jgi:hypothetical protein